VALLRAPLTLWGYNLLTFSEPEAKKLAGIDASNAGGPVIRPGPGPPVLPGVPGMGYGPEGAVLNEEITVPDRIVGLSKLIGAFLWLKIAIPGLKSKVDFIIRPEIIN